MRGHVNNSNIISVDEIRRLIDYDPHTGGLSWKKREPRHFGAPGRFTPEVQSKQWNTRYAGTAALNAPSNGYKNGHIFGRIYRAHRVCFAIHHGYWPEGPIDHINGNKSDNRICNLREVSKAQNGLNRGLNANNTSGCRGVSWVKRKKTWTIRINVTVE